jgi:Spy/CpxP family protein refolding chaperone
MKTKYLIMTLAAAVAVGEFTLYQAQAAEQDAGRIRHPILRRIAERLNLTEEQKAQIKTVLTDEKNSLKSLFTRLHAARKDLRDAIHASSATETSVRAASAKVAAVESDLAVERLKLYDKINPILTDEQRAKAAEMEKGLDEFVDGAISRIGERLAD